MSLCIFSSIKYIFCTLLLMKNIWPFLFISVIMASFIVSSSKVITSVITGNRFGGGVVRMLKSLAPIKENCNVRGIGVAVSVSVSIFTLIVFSFSFTATPNFCSSSIINKPKSLNIMSLPISL